MDNELEDLNKACNVAEKAGIELLQKSHIQSYTRMTASGAQVQVQEHDDSRSSAQHQAAAFSERANKGHKDAYKHATLHTDAAHAHAQAVREQDDRGNKKAADEHREKAKDHLTRSTDKFEGKGSKASAARDHARAFSKYGGDIAEHAKKHADNLHSQV